MSTDRPGGASPQTGQRPAAAPAPRRGRPAGRSAKGAETAARLYHCALVSFAARGYEATTLRHIATDAGVSPGLLYRYFPSKRALLLHLYERLSLAYAERAASLAAGPWTERVAAATSLSLETLSPHRDTLRALVGVLVGGGDDGLFGAHTALSRRRVSAAFETAVAQADAAPACASSLARLAYLGHLAVLLFWLLDRSPQQRATRGLLAWVPWTALAVLVRVPGVAGQVDRLAALVSDGLWPQGSVMDSPPRP